VIGEHPETKAPVEIMDGPYGLYVKHGKTNATLPKEKKPEEVTMPEALALLAEKEASDPKAKRAAKGGKRSGGAKAKKAAAKPKVERPVGARTEAKLAARARKAAKSADKPKET
jgi:DNA topoisomerase-1